MRSPAPRQDGLVPPQPRPRVRPPPRSARTCRAHVVGTRVPAILQWGRHSKCRDSLTVGQEEPKAATGARVREGLAGAPERGRVPGAASGGGGREEACGLCRVRCGHSGPPKPARDPPAGPRRGGASAVAGRAQGGAARPVLCAVHAQPPGPTPRGPGTVPGTPTHSRAHVGTNTGLRAATPAQSPPGRHTPAGGAQPAPTSCSPASACPKLSSPPPLTGRAPLPPAPPSPSLGVSGPRLGHSAARRLDPIRGPDPRQTGTRVQWGEQRPPKIPSARKGRTGPRLGTVLVECDWFGRGHGGWP